MKKILFSIIMLLLLSGCYNYNELNSYAISTGMAIDYEDDEFKVSFLISNSPKNNTVSTTEFQNVVYSGKGKSVFEAVKNIGLISAKELYIGHLSVVVVSEEAAKKGLLESLAFLVTEPQSKKDFVVVLAKNSDASDILKITTPLTEFPSQNISDNIKSTQHLQASVVSVEFNTLLKTLVEKNKNPVLSSISLVGSVKKGESQKNIEYSTPKSYVKLNNLGIFKNDKFVAWATKDESRGINIINNDIREMYLNLNCGNGKIVINTEQFKTKIKVNKKGDIKINVNSNAIINEIACDFNIKDEKNIKKLEKKASKKIKSFIDKAIKLSKKYNTDIFGFGLEYYRNYEKEYKKINDWDKYYKNINIDTNIKVNIKHNGASQQSIERIYNEKDN